MSDTNPMRLWRAYAIAALGGGASVEMARKRADAMLPIDAEVHQALAEAHGQVMQAQPGPESAEGEPTDPSGARPRWNPGHPADESTNCQLALLINGEWELLAGCAWTSLGDGEREAEWVPVGLSELPGEGKPAEGPTYQMWSMMSDRIAKAQHILWMPAPDLPPNPS